jgi:hypothetical protein
MLYQIVRRQLQSANKCDIALDKQPTIWRDFPFLIDSDPGGKSDLIRESINKQEFIGGSGSKCRIEGRYLSDVCVRVKMTKRW